MLYPALFTRRKTMDDSPYVRDSIERFVAVGEEMRWQPSERSKGIGRYEKLLACQALLLRMVLKGGSATIAEMIEELDRIESEIEKRLPEFSFAVWSRGCVFDCVAFLARCNQVSLTRGQGPPSITAKRRSRVRRNEHTKHYLKIVEREAADVLTLMGV